MQLTLDKKAIPAYIKRLRKLHELDYKGKQPIKYYGVGEYGGQLERPHYHIILFNALKELIPIAWSLNKTMFGLCQIGDKGVTAGGARYLAQYMLTGQEDNQLRERPFSLMSKHLGDNYLTPEMKKWHLQKTGKTIIGKNGNLIKTRDRYYMIQDGYKIALPRYYRDKIFPKIYRDIDVPIITAQHDQKEWDTKIKQDPHSYYMNVDGQRETNKSTYSKKQKAKQRQNLEIDSVN